jgi:peptidoglycan/LPS O-acetylase OafA/YrhL
MSIEKPFLNTIRWISATIVMFGHALAWVFALGSREKHLDGPLIQLEYVLDLGGAGVVAFFVVSGFLVGGSVLNARHEFSWRRYSISRFSRIYIVVVPALILTSVLDWSSYFLSPKNPFSLSGWGRMTAPIIPSYGPRNIAASVLSLESVVGGPLGSDHPLWSLGCEWFFYFLFPCVLAVSRLVSRSLVLHGGVCVDLAAVMVCIHQGPMASFG